MKKTLLILFSLFLCAALLVGCQGMGIFTEPPTATEQNASDATVSGEHTSEAPPSYPLSVSVDGTPLDQFTIVMAQPASARYQSTAQSIQTQMHQLCGVWMEIAAEDEAPDGPILLLSDEAAPDDGYFQITVEDGNLIFRTDVRDGHARGFSRFFEAYLQGKEGEFNMDQAFKYEEHVKNYVLYSEFGAKGDGKTNDIKALIAAHDYANANNLEVYADEGFTYYISAADKGAVIKTNTDWTGANFIIDDSEVGIDKRDIAIFNVNPTAASYNINTVKAPVIAGQSNLGITLPQDSIVRLIDKTTKRYIREGKNQNSGSDSTDIIIVDKNGNVDPNAPIIWDYETVSTVRVTPMDTETITIKGGTFTTIANTQPNSSNYYKRGILVRRSNVIVEGITHYVTGEGETGAPYSGILVIQDCANITVRDCVFTAHKVYINTKPTGKVSQGTYDISPSRVIKLTFENCSQTTDILDTKYWGIMGSNFCKNITLKNCTFSRFDAHQGVANVTILDSTLGHQCLNAIGSGLLRVENSTLYGKSLINLRTDYGSTWHGDVLIRDCTWIPNRGNALTDKYAIIGGSYNGFHDFGYPCYMPTNITIDGLHVKDWNSTASFPGIYLFDNITPANTSEAYEKQISEEGFPYHITEKVTISGFTSDSGKRWNVSPNPYMFRNVEIVDLDGNNAD